MSSSTPWRRRAAFFRSYLVKVNIFVTFCYVAWDFRLRRVVTCYVLRSVPGSAWLGHFCYKGAIDTSPNLRGAVRNEAWGK